MISLSPLRYPGGKSKLTNFLSEILKLNNLSNGLYIEAFAGGAGAALNLLLGEYVHEIIINDADYNIFCFWQTILENPEGFKKKINKIKVNLNTWKKQKKILEAPEKYEPYEIGFATFFLNRCNRSGILLNAGPIGGYDQDGDWRIDARFNKEELVKRIERISFYRKRISIYHLDAIVFLKQIVEKQENVKKALVYLDPPYYVKGSALYLNHFDHKDHLELANYLKANLAFKWIMTYDDVAEIREMYKDKKQVKIYLNYSAQKVRLGSELLIADKSLSLPTVFNLSKKAS